MSAKAPQVLSRRTNGTASTVSGQGNEPGEGKGGQESGDLRPKKRRGQGDKKTDNAKGRENDAPRPPRQRQQSDGGKIVLRRLPPGMTEAECIAILGETWDVGKGKVDWFSFIPGKISTDPSKPSRPARAYLHLLQKDDMLALHETVRSVTWEDAKNSFTNPVLVGPPSCELSAYKKVPGNKKRTDSRQGTIDQDPEFMAFLEELANPAPLRENLDVDDGEDANKGDAKVTTTPLVEYLKEKKANRSKESGSGKKRGDGKSKVKDDEASKKKARETKSDKTEKAEKDSKTTVKILTKKAATEQAADAAKNVAKAINAAIAQEAPKNRRAGIATAARILQRDLGLSPGNAHRRARQDAAKAEAKLKEASQVDDAQETASQPTEAPAAQDGKPKANNTGGRSQSGRKGRNAKNGEKGKAVETTKAQPTAANPPLILKKKPEGQANAAASTAGVPAAASANQQPPSPKAAPAERSAKSAATSNKGSQAQKKAPPSSAGTTKAFVKNAIRSQGVTEAALKEVLESFGAIAAIEMDKRKGFAFVDFASHDGFAKALAASPLAVAQGSVQILERKDKKPAAASPGSAGAPSAAAARATGDKGQENDKEKEKGHETRRGRRGRGGRGNNGGGSSNALAAAAPPATTAQSAAQTTTPG